MNKSGTDVHHTRLMGLVFSKIQSNPSELNHVPYFLPVLISGFTPYYHPLGPGRLMSISLCLM